MKGKNCFKPIIALLIIATVSCFYSLPMGETAEIDLANGDRVTGKLITLEKGNMIIETPYNKKLELAWGEVKQIHVDTVTDFVLTDGSKLKGTVRTSSDGTLEIVSESAGVVTVPDFSTLEAINPPPLGVTYNGNLQGNSSLKTGNTENISTNLSGKFVARSKRQRFTLTAAWNYAEDKAGDEASTKISARNAKGAIQYDFFPLEKLFLYVNSSLEGDEFQDLNLRTTVGGGGGYQFFEDDRKKFSLELGVSYFNEDFFIAEDNSYPSGRWAVNAEYKVIPKKVVMFHTHEGFVGMDDAEDFLLRTEQGLRLTIIKNFYTNIQVNLTYDHTPAPGKKETDTIILVGLGYSFEL